MTWGRPAVDRINQTLEQDFVGAKPGPRKVRLIGKG